MSKLKNLALISLVCLSQCHTLFNGCDFDLIWLINGQERTLSTAVFLYVKHFTDMVLLYCLIKPKGINKTLVYFLFSVSILDNIWFFVFSGIGFEYAKIMLSFFVFLFLISKYSRCLKR